MSQNQQVLDQIFSQEMDTEKILKDQEKTETIFYRPSIVKEKRDSYKAVLKFLPNIENINQSIVNKWTVFLHNPDTDQRRSIDCPSTIKRKSVLQDVYFTLRNSSNAQLNQLKDNFSRREVFFSLIQIVEDKQHPELEGQIKIFQYGKQVYEVLEEVMRPKTDLKTANNPFDLFDGKLFFLDIKKVGDFPKYTSSEFLDKSALLVIDDKPMKKDPKNGQKIIEFLKPWAERLMEQSYKDWDDETQQFVSSTIQAILEPYSSILGSIKKRNREVFRNISTIETEEIDKPNKSTKSKSTNNKKIDIEMEENETEESEEDNTDDEFSEVDDLIKKTRKKSKSKVDVGDDDEDFFE